MEVLAKKIANTANNQPNVNTLLQVKSLYFAGKNMLSDENKQITVEDSGIGKEGKVHTTLEARQLQIKPAKK